MHLRRFLFLLFALSAIGPPAFAQSSSGAITSAQCVTIDVTNQSTVGIQVTGTWSGTLQPQISIQGQSPQTIQVTPYSSSVSQTSIVADGNYTARVGGGTTFLLCGNTVGSGTANVYLNATQAVSLNGVTGSSSSSSPSTFNTQQFPSDPEGYMTWQPATLYPAVLAGTCTFSASTTCSISYGTTFSGVPVVNITPVNPGAITFTLTATSTTGFTITASGSNSLAVNYTAATPSGTNCTQLNFQLLGARQNIDFVVPLFNQSLPSNILPTAWVSSSDQASIRLCNQGTTSVSFGTNLAWGAKLLR